MRAWVVREYGAPTDVLRLDEVDEPEPGPGEVQIAVEAITLNFNDIDGIRGRIPDGTDRAAVHPRDGGSRPRACGRRRGVER